MALLKTKHILESALLLNQSVNGVYDITLSLRLSCDDKIAAERKAKPQSRKRGWAELTPEQQKIVTEVATKLIQNISHEV